MKKSSYKKLVKHIMKTSSETVYIILMTFPQEWKEEYLPKTWIPDDTFESLTDKPSQEEWLDNVNQMTNNSAPGSSDITYHWFKVLDESGQILMRTFAELCLKSGQFPKSWSDAHLYPIPKHSAWQGDVCKTRPIILLECFHKIYMRILTKRIQKQCQNMDILRGYNFCGLTKESTLEPITVINTIIEDAKNKNGSCWILFQDMAKAFDSVGTTSLRMSLQRIKMNPTIIDLLIYTFESRTLRVITEYGIADPFIAKSGLDQGDVISPLLWRIFYDPLLYKINQISDLGYPLHVNNNKTQCIKIGSLASAW